MTGDLLVTGGRVLRVGPRAAGEDGGVRDLAVRDGRIADGAPPAPDEVLDATGCVLVPLVVETLEEGRPAAQRYADKELLPGNEATFAVVARPVRAAEARRVLVIRPPDLRYLVLGGRVAVRGGVAVDGPDAPMAPPSGAPWVGAWTDRTGYLVQTLDAVGRYDETRAGRRHAYQGGYWVRGSRIVYLDDTGFWAFGELAGEPTGGVLHHAGYVLDR